MATADTDPVSRYRELARKLKAALGQAKVELAQAKASNDELQAEIAAVKAQVSASPAASGPGVPAQSITRIDLSVDHAAAGRWYLGCTKRGTWTWAQYEALPPLLQDAELLDSYPCLRAGSSAGSSAAASGTQLEPALAAAEAKIRSLEAAFRAYRVRADMANARAAEEAESAAHAAAQSSQHDRLSTELSRLREEVAGLLSEKVRLQKSLTASQRALAAANAKITRMSAKHRADPGESHTPPASPSARAASASLPTSPTVPASPTAAASFGQGELNAAQVAAAFSAYRARTQELLAEKDAELERTRAELRTAAAQATTGGHAPAPSRFPGSPRPGSQLSAPQLEYLQTALAQYLTSADASVRAQLERTLRMLLGLQGESVVPQSPSVLSGLTRLLG